MEKFESQESRIKNNLDNYIKLKCKHHWSRNYWSDIKAKNNNLSSADKKMIFLSQFNPIDCEESGLYKNFMGPAHGIDKITDIIFDVDRVCESVEGDYDVKIYFEDGTNIKDVIGSVKLYYLLKFINKNDPILAKRVSTLKYLEDYVDRLSNK